eukprot:4095914-Amphidinium_carterae.1
MALGHPVWCKRLSSALGNMFGLQRHLLLQTISPDARRPACHNISTVDLVVEPSVGCLPQ